MREIIELTSEETQDLLDTQMCGTLAFVDGDKPYQSPVMFAADEANIYLTLWGEETSRKMRCVRENQNVSFTVYGFDMMTAMTEGAPSAIFEGKLEQITDREGVTQAVRANERKMGAEGMFDHMIDQTMADPDKSMFYRITREDFGTRKIYPPKE
ncbi:MAG: pyridoxamine 5'-phosphate oxidase family protein [Deltaproteobacteria bacterium]|jgi:nitroimidazol reductase NimA-like FMN-containing flavoprotein (pyridoxamine 5'-phosphate oxidase superfamily)|nr:pyridoxamine 5'-phosphate oxidase family protein [Deltaproteobacteria bacterium]